MSQAFRGRLLALSTLLVACDGPAAGLAPGTERGPCLDDGTCVAGLQCLSDLCVRVPDAGPDDPDADAAPAPDGAGIDADLEAPRAYFAEHVAPIVAGQCASCHQTGMAGAPAFGSSYDSYTAYVSSGGTLIGCTATQSTLFTKGAHATDTAPALAPAEAATVRTFIDLEASISAGCAGLVGDVPSTGSIISQADMYLLDLSTLGAGLTDATITFTVSTDVGGLQITALTLHAGPGGLVAVGPTFETCLGGSAMPTAETQDLRVVLGANEAALVGDGSLALPGTLVGDRFSVRFAALLPAAGAQSAPTDNGGACLP